MQALPLVRPQRRAPEPRDGRPPRPLLPLGTERPQDREFGGGGDIISSSLLHASLQPHGPHGAFWAQCGAAGSAVTRVRRWHPVTRDSVHGPGRLFPRGKTSAAPKVRPPLAHGSRRLHQNPRRQKQPQHGLHSFPSLFSRLTACRGQALSCH